MVWLAITAIIQAMFAVLFSMFQIYTFSHRHRKTVWNIRRWEGGRGWGGGGGHSVCRQSSSVDCYYIQVAPVSYRYRK